MSNDVKTTFHHDEMEDKLHVEYTYDAEPILEQNKIERAEFSNYKSRTLSSGLVKVASLHPGDVERLANMGYNVLSPDPAEVKRAVLFIQSEQRKLLTVEGNPFARVNKKWQ